jgi:hypothetical protein
MGSTPLSYKKKGPGLGNPRLDYIPVGWKRPTTLPSVSSK